MRCVCVKGGKQYTTRFTMGSKIPFVGAANTASYTTHQQMKRRQDKRQNQHDTLGPFFLRPVQTTRRRKNQNDVTNHCPKREATEDEGEQEDRRIEKRQHFSFMPFFFHFSVVFLSLFGGGDCTFSPVFWGCFFFVLFFVFCGVTVVFTRFGEWTIREDGYPLHVEGSKNVVGVHKLNDDVTARSQGRIY